MPPENPYAAPQTVDQPIAALFERQHALAENIDLVHSGARLGLKAVWVSLFHLALVLAVTFVAPQLRELRPWMSWTLVGAAAYCFLLGLVAFWQLPPAVDIRGLQTTALVTFVAALVLNTSDGWLFPSLDATGILVWLALNGLVSGIYIVALLWAVARVAQIAKDQAAARSAQYAALMFGLCYGIVTAFYALGLVPALRAHIQYLYSGEARTELITSVIVLSVLALLGLVGYIHALWRLKGLHVDPTA